MNRIELQTAHEDVFDFLRNKLVMLHIEWRTFFYLFVERSERVDVLNAASGAVAQAMQKALLNQVLMAIRALSDHAKSGVNNENLSIRQLVEIAKLHNVDLSEFETKMTEACKPCKRYSDKRIAHYDKPAKFGNLFGLNLNEITEAIKSISELARQFSIQVLGKDIPFFLPMSIEAELSAFLNSLVLGNHEVERIKELSAWNKELSEEEIDELEELQERIPYWIYRAEE